MTKASDFGPWQLSAGVFHSLENDPSSDQPYVTLISNSLVDSVLDTAPPVRDESTSGEIRLTGVWGGGAHRHSVQFAVRGRTVARQFGGDVITDLGTLPLIGSDAIAQPPDPFTRQSRDSTRQLDVGVTLEEHWIGLGSAAIGILRDHYRREVLVPNSAPDTDLTNPRLVNLRLASDPMHGVALYSSYVQGLEDSALAPVSASNRNEPPPATRTWQLDGGARWVPMDRLQFVLGAFKIHKPYFNVDADNVYTLLGRVQHHGVESSLSFNDSGITFLAGAVLIKPRVERSIAEPGATGLVPLGPVPLTLTANADIAPPQWGPWAASMQWNRLSSRVETTDDANRLPPLSTWNAGVRYQLKLLSQAWTVRLDAFNLSDARGLHVSNLEVVMPELSRRFMLSLAADF